MFNNFLAASKVTLVTGATGMLGAELVSQWLTQKPADQHLVILARDGKTTREGAAEVRIAAMLEKRLGRDKLKEQARRITVLKGDVVQAQLGLESTCFNELASRLNQIIHCAADVRFDRPLDEAWRVNVIGTYHLIELARAAQEAGAAVRLDYVSTAYIAGKRKGVVTEADLEHQKGFHNSYEQSKYEAELLLKLYAKALPITIYRPSIIVGHSQTGLTGNFKAFYWPIRLYSSGQIKLLPAVPDCKVDLVPVDYVASAILHLSGQSQTVGQTFHLTAGRDNLMTVGEIAETASAFFGIKNPRTLHPRYLRLLEGGAGKLLVGERTHRAIVQGRAYFPYGALKLEFDNTQTTASLAASGIKIPTVRNLLQRLLGYCLETNWGRRTTKTNVASDSTASGTAVPDLSKLSFF